jgi:hypothetical protein
MTSALRAASIFSLPRAQDLDCAPANAAIFRLLTKLVEPASIVLSPRQFPVAKRPHQPKKPQFFIDYRNHFPHGKL